MWGGAAMKKWFTHYFILGGENPMQISKGFTPNIQSVVIGSTIVRRPA